METKVTVAGLRRSTAPGYNLALIVDAGYDINSFDLAIFENALPVLKEASGALGVLRALDFPGRMHGIQESMADDGLEHGLLHLVLHDHCAELLYYKVIVHRN